MKKAFAIAGMIVGLLFIVLGIVAMVGPSNTYFNGSHTRDVEFGADFYTYQYEATKDVADDVTKLGNFLEKEFDFIWIIVGGIVILTGAAIVCKNGIVLAEAKSEGRKKIAQAAPVEQSIYAQQYAAPQKYAAPQQYAAPQMNDGSQPPVPPMQY